MTSHAHVVHTSSVLVMLDANALMQDVMFEGVVWQIMAAAPPAWDLHLYTSEVAVAEAIAGYERQVADEVAGLQVLSKRFGRLGAANDALNLSQRLLEKAADYPSHIADSLAAASVTVLPTPDASHMDVVRRAVARRRPCDDKGDGYRDTLFWLSVLELAEESEEEKIVLVTRDSDFLNEDKSHLHDDLVADLTQIAAQSRVSVVGDLADVGLSLAERSRSDEGGLRALKEELQDGVVRQYVESLLDSAVDYLLDPRECALPRPTTNALLRATGAVSSLSYELKGGVGDDEAVAEFQLEATAEILLTVWHGPALSETGQTSIIYKTSDKATYSHSKNLTFNGLVRLGRYSRPIGGALSHISARPDDPARAEWAPTGTTHQRAMAREIYKALSSNGPKGLHPSTEFLATLNKRALEGVKLPGAFPEVFNFDIPKGFDPTGTLLAGLNKGLFEGFNPTSAHLAGLDAASVSGFGADKPGEPDEADEADEAE